MKKTQFNNKKQDLLQKKVMYSLLAAGFFCSIGIASTAVAAVASEKVINGDMPSGLETNTEYVKLLAAAVSQVQLKLSMMPIIRLVPMAVL